jgi:HEAT repeat protein
VGESADKEALARAGVGNSPAEIMAFLRGQVVPAAQRQRIDTLIEQLADPQFDVRESATDELIALGPPAVSFLRAAGRADHREVVRRADVCLTAIKGAVDPQVLGTAVRRLVQLAPTEALATLLEVYPFMGDEAVEDEVLTGLGTLGLRDGKPDPLLLTFRHDPLPARRAAVAFVLARYGGLDQREEVRESLGDASALVRSRAVRGLLAERTLRFDESLAAEDRRVLGRAEVAPTAAGLLEFFRRRTLDDAARQRLERLVQQLDSNSFASRQDAARKLVEQGTPALAFLRPALDGGTLELTRRVESCIREIETGPGPVLPLAAVRLLARLHPADAVQVLLAYAPFAEDASVEEEVINALATLAVQQPKVPEMLAAALKDELPTRRALAAVVLGLVGTREQARPLQALLADPESRVRFRAAQGLLAMKKKDAVPTLLALVDKAPLALAVRAEEELRQLADDTPAVSVADSGEGRPKIHEAWVSWWRDRGDRIDLSRPRQQRPYLGLTLVAELSSGRRGEHKLWEFDTAHRVRWETTEPVNPIDAQVLSNQRILVAEYGANRVTERDAATMQVVWEKKTTNLVVSCQRLPNGNTFIATYNGGILEVTPAGQDVYSFNPLPNGIAIVNALKLRSGRIACLSVQGKLIEVDNAGRKLRETGLENAGGWNGLEELSGDRLLVALQLAGKVVELDAERKTVWECRAAGAVHAIRLPNGHILAACGNTQKLLEVDRGGKVVWETTTVGRPFHVRRR